jgi:hypothetical protein
MINSVKTMGREAIHAVKSTATDTYEKGRDAYWAVKRNWPDREETIYYAIIGGVCIGGGCLLTSQSLSMEERKNTYIRDSSALIERQRSLIESQSAIIEDQSQAIDIYRTVIANSISASETRTADLETRTANYRATSTAVARYLEATATAINADPGKILAATGGKYDRVEPVVFPSATPKPLGTPEPRYSGPTFSK